MLKTESVVDERVCGEDSCSGRYRFFRLDGRWIEGKLIAGSLLFLRFIGGPESKTARRAPASNM